VRYRAGPLAQMKIVCLLRHDELRPLLATCTRLRQAASAAITVHFNFCTPEPVRGEKDEELAVLRSPSPHYLRAAIALSAEASGGPPAPQHRSKHRRRRPLGEAARVLTAAGAVDDDEEEDEEDEAVAEAASEAHSSDFATPTDAPQPAVLPVARLSFSILGRRKAAP
jgi:hypothetical protein